MPLAAQMAKLLTKGARELLSTPTEFQFPVLKHAKELPPISDEQVTNILTAPDVSDTHAYGVHMQNKFKQEEIAEYQKNKIASEEEELAAIGPYDIESYYQDKKSQEEYEKANPLWQESVLIDEDEPSYLQIFPGHQESAKEFLEQTRPISEKQKRKLEQPFYHGTKSEETLQSIETEGFLEGKSAEIQAEGTSLSLDPLISFKNFAEKDFNRLLYVEFPKDMKKGDILNMSSIDYLLPKNKEGVVIQPNNFIEGEVFVSKQGGYRKKLKVRKLTDEEKKEIQELSDTSDKLQNQIDRFNTFGFEKGPEGNFAPYNNSAMPTVFKEQIEGELKILTQHQSGLKIPFKLAETTKEQKARVNAEVKIELYEKDNKRNLIKMIRELSSMINKLKTLKGSKSYSLRHLNKLKQALNNQLPPILNSDMLLFDYKKVLKDPVNISVPDHKNIIAYGKFGMGPEQSKEIIPYLNSNNTTDPLVIKLGLLQSLLDIKATKEQLFRRTSEKIKDEYARRDMRFGEKNADAFRDANKELLTKLWSDYNKANDLTLEFMFNNFGYAMGGVVDMRNGGKVGAAVVAASLMASGGQAMDMRDGGVVGMEDGGWLKETSKIASKVGDVLSDVVDDPSKWLKAGVGELFDREQLSGQPLLSSYDLPHAELGKLSEQTLPQKYFGDINRYREIWSMYHGSDPSLEKEIQFVMHQNIKGKAPKQKEIDRITNEIVLDFKGDRGTDPKAPEINTDILAEALRRIAYHETYGGKVKRQAEKGPARGWWQVEPKTAYNMLKGKKGVGEAEDQNFLGPKVRKRLLKQTGLSLKQINKLGRDEFNKLLENNQGFNATVAALNVLTKASQRGKLNLLY